MRPAHSFIRAAHQGLLDLASSGASDVVFVDEGRSAPGPAFEGLSEMAFDAGFVVSTFALGGDVGFEALDTIVRGFVKNLAARDAQKKGLVGLLDAFVTEHKRRASERFAEASEAFGLGGDLGRIAHAYVEAAGEARRELRVLKAWLEGSEIPAIPDDMPEGILEARTAKPTLAALSRLVRVLGYDGLVLVARRAGHLCELTPVRRETAYTVLRELIDNADSPRGLVSTRLYVSGASPLFASARGIVLDGALSTRVFLGEAVGDDPSSAVPLPHNSLISLDVAHDTDDAGREPEAPAPRKARAVRALVRASQGLPPLALLDALTVGYERIDETLTTLFEHASNDGSVFAIVSGAYGTGKTHLLLHVEERALAERRPVFRLAVERIDVDLGNPQRHLGRMLEQTTLPLPGSPSPLDRLAHWTRADASTNKLEKLLGEIVDAGGDAASAARKAQRALGEGPTELAACLAAVDLVVKPNSASYRADAYGRLLLWLELLERLEGFAGPLVIIDEAENLYRGGTSRSERRTALRSLAFYCGGTLPRACVVLAVTPDTLEELRGESQELLDEVADQKTLLAWEDGTMLRRRLGRGRAIDVVKLSREQLAELGERARRAHAAVRGSITDREWDDWLGETIKKKPTPRLLLRSCMHRLEKLWWLGG